MTRMEWSPPRTLRPSTTEWTWTVRSRVAGHKEIAGGGGVGGLERKMGRRKEGRKEMFYLTTHSTHFIYVCIASDIW